MAQYYSDETREDDAYVLPDLEVFQLTAAEVAAGMEDEICEYQKRHAFRLASMNSHVRDQMLDCMVSELGITGGWFYWYCFPGCLPDSEPIGPFETQAEALADARANAEE